MSNLTLLDIAKRNGSDKEIGLIEEVVTQVPELALLPARTRMGTSYKTVTRTGLPTTGFRGANEGVTPGKSTYKDELFQMYILDGQIEMDKRVADADEDGPASVLADEASGIGLSALITLASQIYYGVNSDTDKGFNGIKNFTPFGGDLTLNAAGTSAGTASSAFFVKFGKQDVQMVYGNNTTLTLGETRIQQLTDVNGKKYTGYVNDLGGWCGLQFGNIYCAGRICNLTADAGKGLTETLIHTMLDTFPQSRKPDAMMISGRSMTQLRIDMGVGLSIKSKSATVRTPSTSQAKLMIEESTGLQVIISDSIVNTDAIES